MSAFRLASEWARGNRLRTKAVFKTGSTNDDAKRGDDPLMQLTGPGDSILYIADMQTKGRGRNQSEWLANSGHALLSSWVFAIGPSNAGSPGVQPILSPMVGLTLYEAVHAAWPELNLAIKPPNDLHVIEASHSKQAGKLAGLLIEVVSDASEPFTKVIVGLGLNVSGSPDGVSPYPATSLAASYALLAASLAPSQTPATFQESHLFLFLNTFRQNLKKAVDASQTLELNRDWTDKLKAAIVRHPQYSDLEDVSVRGDLIRKSGVVPWSEL